MTTKTDKDFFNELQGSVHKVWLAGLGALSAAGEEGNKLFNNLVEKGEKYEKEGGKRVEDMKSKAEEAAGKVRDQAETTWDKIEQRVDDTVATVLRRTGVPSREEIATLTRRVEELTAVVEKLKAKTEAKKA